MKFPNWVDDPNLPDEDRASNRLKYLILLAALHATGNPTLRSFGAHVGMHHTGLSRQIHMGSFSYNAARCIARACPQFLTAEGLVDPLSMKGIGNE